MSGFAVHDLDYYDRSKTSYLRRLSGKLNHHTQFTSTKKLSNFCLGEWDGKLGVLVNYRDFRANVITRDGFLISDDLVKAPMLTKEYYENKGQPMPKVSQKFIQAWLKFYRCQTL